MTSENSTLTPTNGSRFLVTISAVVSCNNVPFRVWNWIKTKGQSVLVAY